MTEIEVLAEPPPEVAARVFAPIAAFVGTVSVADVSVNGDGVIVAPPNVQVVPSKFVPVTVID